MPGTSTCAANVDEKLDITGPAGLPGALGETNSEIPTSRFAFVGSTGHYSNHPDVRKRSRDAARLKLLDVFHAPESYYSNLFEALEALP